MLVIARVSKRKSEKETKHTRCKTKYIWQAIYSWESKAYAFVGISNVILFVKYKYTAIYEISISLLIIQFWSLCLYTA